MENGVFPALACRTQAYTFNASSLGTRHLKKRILIQNRGGFKFQTGGILTYVEDLELGSNKEFGPKDFFEMACS